MSETALQLYRGLPLAARLHTRIRWLSCPFPAIESALPETGRILELGCGHGLFAAYAAMADRGREVHGVDIDADKIEVARVVAERARTTGHTLTVDVVEPDEVPPGPWDAVVVVDVLYLLTAAEQRALLERAAAQLAPGGSLVIKEMSPTPAWKARWNAVQEGLSVRVLGITEGRREFTFVPPAEVAEWLRPLGLTVRTRRIDRGRLHPHHLLRATRS